MHSGDNRYRIISVPRDAPGREEPMGSKRKFWFRDENQQRCLFKFNRIDHGEDWAEKIAAELASALGYCARARGAR